MKALSLKAEYENAFVLLFSAVAIFFVYTNFIFGIPSPFGMIVDFSAVPVFLASFLFSYRAGLKILVLLSLAILLTPYGLVGSLMKFVATSSLLLSIYMFERLKDNAVKFLSFLLLLFASFVLLGSLYSLSHFLYSIVLILLFSLLVFSVGRERAKPSFSYLAGFIFGVFVRGIGMAVANIYFASKLFFKLSPEEFINSFFPGGLSSAFLLIFGWNALQSVVEVFTAYLIYRLFKHHGLLNTLRIKL